MSRLSTWRSRLTKPFFSPKEQRLRAGWRILGQLLLLRILMVVLGLVIYPRLSLKNLPDDITSLINYTLWALAVTLSVFLARRYLDRRTFISLGLRWNRQALLDLLFGFALAGFLMGLIYNLEWMAGWLTFEGFVWQQLPWYSVIFQSLVGLLSLGVTVSWLEELSDRGYILQNLKDGLNLPWALFLSSAMFSARHLGNPNTTWISTLGIFLAGIFLAYGWVRTRQLWIPLGLHAGWNFFEGTVFGFPVSGFKSFQLIKQTVEGPEWITGGDFGPEAGFVVILAMAIGMILIYWWSKGRLRSLTD
ncbi:type II CAAX endopeptidase family protein [Allocoleopsis sp.]|uniref:CPBP family intramembrane glutamic endopeptidase n=1 Tax=Allocoleopsis sp. TaxID=3088169 RepID=UPI002FD6EF8F